ncbi:mannosyltransferase family protein [Actinopolymorpha pittospori]
MPTRERPGQEPTRSNRPGFDAAPSSSDPGPTGSGLSTPGRRRRQEDLPGWDDEPDWSASAEHGRRSEPAGGGPVTDVGWYTASDVESRSPSSDWPPAHHDYGAADEPTSGDAAPRWSTDLDPTPRPEWAANWSGASSPLDDPNWSGDDAPWRDTDWRERTSTAAAPVDPGEELWSPSRAGGEGSPDLDADGGRPSRSEAGAPTTAGSGGGTPGTTDTTDATAAIDLTAAAATDTTTPADGATPEEPADRRTTRTATASPAAATKPAATAATTRLPVPSWLEWLPVRLRPTSADVEVLGWWLLTRVGILMLAVSGPWLFHGQGKVPSFLDSWKQWDFWHFDRIATHGYFAPGWDTPIEAFFPGLPALLRLGTYIGLPTVVAGLALSLVAGGIAAVALARLAESEWGPGAGRYAAAMWMLAPPAIFLAAPYTEALFLGLAIPAWLAARRGHWWLAAILAAGASTVRVSGIFLVVALAVEFLTSSKRKQWLDGLWLLLPLVPLGGYMAYLKVNTGDWLRWYHAQSEEWYRGFTMPWQSFFHTWDAATGRTTFGDVGDALTANFEWMFRAELVAMLVGVVITVVLLVLRRWGEATWVGVQVAAFATSYWFFSVPRAVLLWFPLWIGLGAIAARRPWVWRAYVLIAVPLFGIWAVAYLTGKWSG